ncbi:MAG: glycogen synthase GlgA [Parachlamydia sp.]|nr:glycogen synthase GlgA [Parachlamydia sp.]
MYCVHIASELAPVAKVGGLADVLLGLCRELSWKGHDVDIILPKYDCLNIDDIRDFAIDIPDLLTFYEGEWHHNTVWIGWVENLKVYFIEPHNPRLFFNRGCFYGCEDDLERYLYFSRAAMEFLYKKTLRPDIIHLHDWQTAAIAPLFREMYQALDYTGPKLVFTIHNIEYQGKCIPADLDKIGLKGDSYLVAEKLQDPMSPQLTNLLKGAIVYSDYVTTVSPSYAKEVKTPAGGRGLDKVLIQYENKFSGILNGIDYSYWNPEIDRHLPAHFSSREAPTSKKDHNTIDRKAYVKLMLREQLLLSEQHKPIVGCIARLVPQKGVELIKHALNFTVFNGGQFVLLGSSPIPSINAEFQALKHHFAEDPNVHLNLHHNEELAHRIYAGADMFIVPSIFEPCGLTQMIALKYGTIPIVRKTGGLADTIFDVDNSGRPFEKTNGYTFDFPDAPGLESALKRAFDCWFHDPEKWRKLMINGMNIDFSWNHPSNLYLEVYHKLTGKGGPA